MYVTVGRLPLLLIFIGFDFYVNLFYKIQLLRFHVSAIYSSEVGFVM